MQRIWSVDFLRGLAVLAMVAYNGSFAFYLLNGLQWNWFWAAFPIAGAFIFLSGVVLRNKKRPFSRFAKRAVKLGLLAVLVSAATFVWFPGCFVKFGILHFFAAAALLAYPLQKTPHKLFLGAAAIAVGIIIYPLATFCTLDWFPILPWFGLYLFGMHWSEQLKSKIKINALNIFATIGRHSLLVYVLHMPLIVAAFILLGWVPNFIL